jgi:ABC-2 type transport system permease protein
VRRRGTSGEARATFTDALRAEWTKLWTLRSAGAGLLATTVTGIAMAVAFSRFRALQHLAGAATRGAAFDPTCVSLIGGLLIAQAAMAGLGALSVTSEYTAGTMRLSSTAVPQLRLIAAKGVLIAALAFVQGEVLGFGSFLAGQRAIGSVGVPGASLGQPHVLRAVLGTGVYQLIIALAGVAIGVLVRSTAGALVAVLATTTVVPLLLTLFPGTPGTRWWPVCAGARLVMVVPSPDRLPGWSGPAVMAVETALLLLVAGWVAVRRDS